MKAGIISINLHTRKLNYGAVLHSWYFRQLLRTRYGFDDCEIVDYLTPEMEKEDVRASFAKEMSGKYPGPLSVPVRLAFNRRFKKFERFFGKHMRVSEKQYTHAAFGGDRLPYDMLFFESDVIWSPHYFNGSFDPAYFGAFPAMQGMKKIVYSASMGDAMLDDAHRSALKDLLRYPDAISMRETYATQLVSALTDKPVCDVVDPVLLADEADFDPITAKRLVKEDYVLVYFPIKPNKFTRDCALKYAAKRGLKVVEVSDRPYDFRFCRTFASAGIEEFVSLVRNASAVFCNSLHGVCLSLVFHKEFYACERNGGMKYLDLCRKFGLEERYVVKDAYRELEPINWEKTENIRRGLRENSLKWLDSAIKDLM